MADISRRGFFGGAVGTTLISICAIATPVVLGARPRKVSQSELLEAIVNHAAWLEDREKGKKAVFNDRDLSGLAFDIGNGAVVDLRGVDFTNADMTGVTGKEVSFFRASLDDAKLSRSEFAWASFANASLRRAKCDNVVWGWDPASSDCFGSVEETSVCGFQNADAGRADFSNGRVRGLFHETRFVAANLTGADFSYSHFCGTGFSRTSFHKANLSGAKFE